MGFARALLGVLTLNALLAATADFNPSAVIDLILRNSLIVGGLLMFSMVKSLLRWAKSYVEFRELCEKFPAFLMKDLILLRQLPGKAWSGLRRWSGAVWAFFCWLASFRVVLISNRQKPGSPQLPGGLDPEPDPGGGGGGSGGGGAGSRWRQVTQRRPDGSPVNWKIMDGGGIKALLDRLIGWLRAALGYAVPGTAAPRRLRAATASLLAGTILSGLPGHAAVPLIAKAPEPRPMHAAPAPDTSGRMIRSIRVEGAQRIEPDTVLSYTRLRVGGAYTNDTLDQAIKDLLASELLADVQIEGAPGNDLIIRVRENPVINRVIFEGNKRLKQDKIDAALKLRPRQIFTRTAVRADVSRLIELYRRAGRFAATVKPTVVQLDQNRADLVFAIVEGPVGRVRGIDIVGAAAFSDAELREAMAPKWRGLGGLWSDVVYDADQLAVEQARLRDFYLTQGYADFRVISAVTELTPDKQDFIITYGVEEGQRYRFAKVGVDCDIPGFDGTALADALPVAPGQWYDAKAVEDAVALLAANADNCGYAFAEIAPVLERNAAAGTIDLAFAVRDGRTYVERADRSGAGYQLHALSEIGLNWGDTPNMIERSRNRINSRGYFQDKFGIEHVDGSTPDRIELKANVEEPTNGELTLSAGFSSLEQFILQASIRQRNFRGKGQTVSASLDYSTYARAVELGLTAPYLFNQNLALGGTLFRRDYGVFNYVGSDRAGTYSQVSTGMQIVGDAGLMSAARVDVAADPAGRALLVLTDDIEDTGTVIGGRDYYLSRTVLDLSVGVDGKVAAGPVTDASVAPSADRFMGDNASPRLKSGFGVNWNSPFGPLKIDLAKALLSGEPAGDDTTKDALPPARA
jgi:outer membrane protein assembly factor BamA